MSHTEYVKGLDVALRGAYVKPSPKPNTLFYRQKIITKYIECATALMNHISHPANLSSIISFARALSGVSFLPRGNVIKCGYQPNKYKKKIIHEIRDKLRGAIYVLESISSQPQEVATACVYVNKLMELYTPHAIAVARHPEQEIDYLKVFSDPCSKKHTRCPTRAIRVSNVDAYSPTEAQEVHRIISIEFGIRNVSDFKKLIEMTNKAI